MYKLWIILLKSKEYVYCINNMDRVLRIWIKCKQCYYCMNNITKVLIIWLKCKECYQCMNIIDNILIRYWKFDNEMNRILRNGCGWGGNGEWC